MTPLELLAMKAVASVARQHPAATGAVVFSEPDPEVAPMPPHVEPRTLGAVAMRDLFIAGVGNVRAYSFAILPNAGQRPGIEASFHNSPHNPLWIELD